MNARLLGLIVVLGSLPAQSGLPAVFRSYPTRGVWRASRCRPTPYTTPLAARPTRLQLGDRLLVEDLPAARWPAAGCSDGFLPAILHGVQFSASRWPGSAGSSAATNGHRDIAPVKVLTDTEHHAAFEGNMHLLSPIHGYSLSAILSAPLVRILAERDGGRPVLEIKPESTLAMPRCAHPCSSDHSSDALGVALWC
jgi:hypothetical protein